MDRPYSWVSQIFSLPFGSIFTWFPSARFILFIVVLLGVEVGLYFGVYVMAHRGDRLVREYGY